MKKSLRIGIHQPNFLPWMGYFYKMSQCDIFVLLDHVEFTKKSYTKRVKIHKADNDEEEQYLTIPLKKHSDHASINALQMVEDHKWQKKIRNLIYQTYHKAPYYHQVQPLIERFFETPLASNSFSEFTIEVIKYVAECLGIKPKWIISSDLDLEYSESDVNLDIIAHLEGDLYISGMGAQKYQNEELFTENKIKLEYSDFPTHFEALNIPAHFLNKSVISYLAHFDIEEVRKIIADK